MDDGVQDWEVRKLLNSGIMQAPTTPFTEVCSNSVTSSHIWCFCPSTYLTDFSRLPLLSSDSIQHFLPFLAWSRSHAPHLLRLDTLFVCASSHFRILIPPYHPWPILSCGTGEPVWTTGVFVSIGIFMFIKRAWTFPTRGHAETFKYPWGHRKSLLCNCAYGEEYSSFFDFLVYF